MSAATVTPDDIVRGLRDLGIGPGDILLAHSSLSSFGHVECGAEAVIDALLETVAPGGTVMVPTITGTANHNAENPPVFDARNTPCWTGTIPETFRKRPDAIRSLHATHSVAAIGPRAEELTREHVLSLAPCDERSPYIRMERAGGKIIFLGVPITCCTTLHGVEELSGATYHMQRGQVDTVIIDEHGERHIVRTGLHQWGIGRNFPRIEPGLLEQGIMRIGRIGEATVRVIDAGRMVGYTLERMKTEPRVLLADGTARAR